jgi:peptidoglycan/xylan/chitin deacetylase (PgdA/CDA1 family)
MDSPLEQAVGWPSRMTCAVSLSFDDGLASHFNLAVPLLNRYGKRATFYLTTHLREGLTAESRKELIAPWLAARAVGHEIGNHTRSHPCSTNWPWTVELDRVPLEAMSLDDAAHEIDEAQRLFQREFGFSPATFAYPCGKTFVGRGASCRSYVPLVAERFIVGRTYNDECSAAPLRCDLAQVPALRMDDRPLTELLELVEDARRSGHWLVLVGHEVVLSPRAYSTPLSTLEGLLQYFEREGGIWVDTVDRVGRHVRDVQLGSSV